MGCKCSRPRGLDSPHLKHKPGSGDTEDPLSFESDIKLKPSNLLTFYPIITG